MYYTHPEQNCKKCPSKLQSIPARNVHFVVVCDANGITIHIQYHAQGTDKQNTEESSLLNAVKECAVKVYIYARSKSIYQLYIRDFRYNGSEDGTERFPEGRVQQSSHHHAHTTEDNHPKWVGLRFCAVIGIIRMVEPVACPISAEIIIRESFALAIDHTIIKQANSSPFFYFFHLLAADSEANNH